MSSNYNFEECNDGNFVAYWPYLPTGTYYYPVVMLPGYSRGAYTIHLSGEACPPPPANDNCIDAILIGDTSNLAFSTVGATFDGPGDCILSPDIWYLYTAPCNGYATVSLCGSEYDTRLAVYETAACNPFGPLVACDDNSCGPFSSLSLANFIVSEGNQYMIEVGGNLGAIGGGMLSTSCVVPPPDLCVGSEYQNGAPDWQNGLFCERWSIPGELDSWVVDDISFAGFATITRLSWTSVTDDAFDFQNFGDIMILANDGSGGGPGTVIAEMLDESVNRTFTGEYRFFRPVYWYEVNGLSIGLEAGTYWIGMRPVNQSTSGTNMWATAPLSDSETYFKSPYYGVPDWTPGSNVFGGYPYNVSFCVDIAGSGCSYVPGDINGNGAANGIDVTFGVSYFKGGAPPPVTCPDCPNPGMTLYGAGDVNGNCAFNGIDITYFVAYLKGSLNPLRYCPDCPPTSGLAGGKSAPIDAKGK
jgi:hypothetical protein